MPKTFLSLHLAFLFHPLYQESLALFWLRVNLLECPPEQDPQFFLFSGRQSTFHLAGNKDLACFSPYSVASAYQLIASSSSGEHMTYPYCDCHGTFFIGLRWRETCPALVQEWIGSSGRWAVCCQFSVIRPSLPYFPPSPLLEEAGDWWMFLKGLWSNFSER